MTTACLHSLILIAIGQVSAGDDTSREAQTTSRPSLERMVADLWGFEVSLATDPPQKLKLSDSPVLRWSYPIRNVDDGAAFVWLSGERPLALATVMSYRDRAQNLRRAYELLSLAPGRMAAVKGGERVWEPDKPGLSWRELPGAGPPADSAAGRRRQMHDLAARFRVSVESDKNRYQLRLLSQPLYRYRTDAGDVLDGTLFAFAEGTDPEVILALESSATEPKWKFAAARLTRWAIEIHNQDKLVEQFEQARRSG